MIDFRHFPDVFNNLVNAVKLRYVSDGPAISYEYGTDAEFISQCLIKDTNQLEKYPLIWLVWGPKDNQQVYTDPCIYSIAPRVFICSLTNPDDMTDQKYTNTLKAVLYPIFDLLVDEFGYNGNIELDPNFKYTVNDHPYWTEPADQFPDHLSAIEIKFENLLIIQQ